MAKIRSFKPNPNQPLSDDNRSNSIQPSQGGILNQVKSKFKNYSPHQAVKLIPLGGVGDVTKNMYVYEYGNDIVIIDCGLGFPDPSMLGVDLVIPDITYLKQNKNKIRGIVISHGHDDHIGGLPYLWPQLKVPVYSQKLTCGLIKSKFTEHNLPKDKIVTVNINDSVKLGAFEISFYRVTHSIPDATGIVLKTPVGTIVHQSDFKIDWTTVNHQVTDVGKIAQVGSQGVLFMTIDCLRIDKPGWTQTELTIQPNFEEIEQKSPGKLLITTTSSNITRLQQAVNVAAKSGRKLALSGRSLESNFQVARDLGYLDVPPGLVISQEEVKRFTDDKLLILIAGSQGQPGSALTRAANNDHRFIKLKKGDSIIFSADPIPLSEVEQTDLIDTLSKMGCSVYYSAITPGLHVSGHGSQEEIKTMVNLVKPRYLMPIGGTYRHMVYFSQIMRNMGYPADKILLANDGDVVSINQPQVKIDGRVEVSNVYVDGLGVGDVGNVVLRDRQVMSEDGIVVVIVPFNNQTGKFSGTPEIISRGFVYEKEAEELLEQAKRIVANSLGEMKEGIPNSRYIRHQVEENLEKFFYDETKRRPLIITLLMDL